MENSISMTYTTSMMYSTEKNIDSNKIDSLFKAVGWETRGQEKCKEMLLKSSFVFSVWDGENLIGFSRILEDGIMCMFYDVCVHPDYQRKGIGRKIMETLIDQTKDKHYISVGLFVSEENPAATIFYEKFGFKEINGGMELVKYMDTNFQ